MNYMDYTDDAGMNLFTSGQKNRMRALFSPGGFRECFAKNTILDKWCQSQIYYSGPNTVCSTGATFTINNLPPVDSIIWSCGPNISISSGQNTSTCNFYTTGEGNSWVRVRLVTSCGRIILPQKTIWVGEPLYPVINSTSPYIWSSSYYYPEAKVFTIMTSGDVQFYDENINTYGLNADNFQWTWSSDGVCCLYNTTPGGQFFYGAYPGTVRIRTIVQNECGTSYWSVPVFVEVIEEMYLYPNPASDNVQVSIKPSSNSSNGTKTLGVKTNYSVRITNSYGTLVHSSKETSNNFTLSTSKLTNGTYFIEVSDGKNTYHKQLVVKH